MEQIKEAEKIRMIDPVEGDSTHLEAHEKLNAAVEQFYGLFDELAGSIKLYSQKQEDAEEVHFASFSKLEKKISDLKDEIKKLNKGIEDINSKLDKGGNFISKRYQGIVDTDLESTIELESIGDEELRGRNYLATIAINETFPNQGTGAYTMPKASIVHGEYVPRIYLMAKQGEHAVLEYDFTVILTEI